MQQMETSRAESLTQNDQHQSRTNHPWNDLDHEMSDTQNRSDPERFQEDDDISSTMSPEAESDRDSLADNDEMSDADVEVKPAVASARRLFLRGVVARLGIEETEGLQVQLHDHTPHGVLADLGPELAFTWHDHRNATPPVPLVEVTVHHEPAPGAQATNNVLPIRNPLSAQEPEADEDAAAQHAPDSES